jgi:hypothetical protein
MVNTIGGVSGTLELTSGVLTSSLPEHRVPGNRLPIGGLIPAVAGCVILLNRRNIRGKGLMLVVGMLSSAALLSMAACGVSGSFNTKSQPGYVTGTFTINVTVTGATRGAPDFNQTVTTFPVNVTISE